MADTEEPQFNSLAERIAALNKQKNFQVSDVPRKRPPPPPPPSLVRPVAKASGDDTSVDAITARQTSPPLPCRPNRGNPPPLPRRDTQPSISAADGGEAAAQHNGGRPVPPPLPSRTPSSTALTPAHATRRPSTQSGLLVARRNSGSSEISQHSTVSSLSLGHASSASRTTA